jgi:hypothetical protein
MISAVCYFFGALTISVVLGKVLPQTDADRPAVRYYSVFFASLVWIFGGGYISAAVSLAKQYRWWPLSILIAALHGGIVVNAITFILGGISEYETAVLFLIAGSAAAISYIYFLIASRIICWRSAPHAQRPTA